MYTNDKSILFTAVLLMFDQVTDIIYVWYSVFSNTTVLYLAAVFCFSHVAIVTCHIFINSSITHSIPGKFFAFFWKSFAAFERGESFAELEGGNSLSRGWVFHTAMNWELYMGEFSVWTVYIILIDIVWIAFRTMMLLLTFGVSVGIYILLLACGSILYASKLMAANQVRQAYWQMWNSSHLNAMEDDSVYIQPAILNSMVLMETLFEAAPQIVIQIYNGAQVYGEQMWPALSIISIFASCLTTLIVLDFFIYHLNAQNGNFSAIPRFDLTNIVDKAINKNTTKFNDNKERI
jgi:hypothetical protein